MACHHRGDYPVGGKYCTELADQLNQIITNCKKKHIRFAKGQSVCAFCVCMVLFRSLFFVYAVAVLKMPLQEIHVALDERIVFIFRVIPVEETMDYILCTAGFHRAEAILFELQVVGHFRHVGGGDILHQKLLVNFRIVGKGKRTGEYMLRLIERIGLIHGEP